MDAEVAVIEPARTGVSPPAGTAPSVKAPEPRTAAVGDSDRSADLPGRRTVTIRGRGAERYVPARPAGARRPSRRRHERSGFRPDRAAMWAVLLGVMLILAAATSAHAATLHALAQQLH